MISFYGMLQLMQPTVFGFRPSQPPQEPAARHTMTHTEAGVVHPLLTGLTLAELQQLRDVLLPYLHQHGIPTAAYPPPGGGQAAAGT
jgi:hypothetical protein